MSVVDIYRQKQKRIRKYCISSLLLTLLVLFLSGCTSTLLMSGDNRIAYDRIQEIKNQFYYPNTVRIVSGTVSGNILYCTLSANNRLGYAVNGSYVIYSGGIIYESDNSLCYGRSLDVDLINRALNKEISVDQRVNSSIFGSLTKGGTTMLIVYLIILVAYLAINGFLASNASDVANDKGYEKAKWFHMCFWLGPIAYVIIAAMPDLSIRNSLDEMLNILKSGNSSEGTSSSTAQASSSIVGKSSYTPPIDPNKPKKVCPQCGARNNRENTKCFACGEPLD